MNQSEFNKIVNDQIKLIKKTLIKKQTEYNFDEDRLSFFKRNGEFLARTPEQALWAMASKHFISLTDMINSGKNFSTDIWNEKITDAISYLFLLKGLVADTGRSTDKNIKTTKSSDQKTKKVRSTDQKIKKSVILNEERK